jgi:hypothetical protein
MHKNDFENTVVILIFYTCELLDMPQLHDFTYSVDTLIPFNGCWGLILDTGTKCGISSPTEHLNVTHVICTKEF